MSFKSDLLNWVEVAQEESLGNTRDGLDMVFDILDHIASGGTLDNFEVLTRDEAVATLAVAWLDMRFAINVREGLL